MRAYTRIAVLFGSSTVVLALIGLGCVSPRPATPVVAPASADQVTLSTLEMVQEFRTERDAAQAELIRLRRVVERTQAVLGRTPFPPEMQSIADQLRQMGWRVNVAPASDLVAPKKD